MSSFETTTFAQLKHPFVWTAEEDRDAVLANVNEPIWHRFIEEAERHFAEKGSLAPAGFPVFCHRGDLDEVMAACVLATVRNDPKLWHWIGDWLREALAYYRLKAAQWAENRYAVMRGERPEGCPGNTRQFFDGFTDGGPYWVEGGLMSVMFHLLDQLEAYAPNELNGMEKLGLLAAIGNYADRFAFHEERLKYNNRGMWANAAVLLSSVAKLDTRSGALLRMQAARRNEEFRTTFLDDGFHVEGAPDYHLMAVDSLLAYLLTASNLDNPGDVYAGRSAEGGLDAYPDFVELVRAYLKTVIPGPVLWNQPRGCSVSTPVTVRPALVQAWRLSQDPELGWLLKERMGEVDPSGLKTPLTVTNTALLGLGHYQPLINFWLFRPVDECHPPKAIYHNMPGYGTVFSRSSWGEDASCVSVRYGYEGTGKGHRDHAHIAVSASGEHLLKDPFPRFGPKGLDTAMYHNTVVIDNNEPSAVVGRVLSETQMDQGSAVLIENDGGSEPDRLFLGDPCEETNYWFTNRPQPAGFQFLRAVIHLHAGCVVMVDQVRSEAEKHMDWFFHSDLPSEGYDPTASERTESYQCRQRYVVAAGAKIEMSFRGDACDLDVGEAQCFAMTNSPLQPKLSCLCADAPLKFERGHHTHMKKASLGGGTYEGESDYYVRARASAPQARVCWALTWGKEEPAIDARETEEGYTLDIQIHDVRWLARIDFNTKQVSLEAVH